MRSVAEAAPPEAMCVTSLRSDETERAMRFYQQERFLDAIDAAEMALRAPDLDPVWSSWLRFLIARSAWHQGDRARAEQILDAMVADPYEPLRWSAARWLCQLEGSVPTSDASDACPTILRFPPRAP